MKRRPFLPGVSPVTRAIFFMLVALLCYGLWLALLVRTGLIESDTPNRTAATLLHAPLLPVAHFDLWLRITLPRRC